MVARAVRRKAQNRGWQGTNAELVRRTGFSKGVSSAGKRAGPQSAPGKMAPREDGHLPGDNRLGSDPAAFGNQKDCGSGARRGLEISGGIYVRQIIRGGSPSSCGRGDDGETLRGTGRGCGR